MLNGERYVLGEGKFDHSFRLEVWILLALQCGGCLLPVVFQHPLPSITSTPTPTPTPTPTSTLLPLLPFLLIW